MPNLYLIVRVAGQVVAVDTAQVGSVIEVGAITPVPRVAPHVAGLFALRSHVLTVIDTHAALGRARMARDTLLHAVIVSLEGHNYALLVDEVVDVVSAGAPVGAAAVLGGGWDRAAIGRITYQENAVLLIDAAVLILGPDAMAA